MQDPQPSTGDTITPHFVTVAEAAEIIGAGTSPWTVNRLCNLGAIESAMPGRRRMVRLSSVHEYANNLTRASA